MKKRLLSGMILLLAAGLLISCVPAQTRAARIAEETYQKYWGNWDKVVEKTTEAIRIAPDFAWPYYQRGVAHAALKQYDKAISDLGMAIDIDTNLWEAYTERAAAFIVKKNFDKAEMDLNAALSLEPYSIPTLLTMVELQSVTNNPGSACMFLRKAVLQGFGNFDYLQFNKNFSNLVSAECFREFIPGNQ